MRHAPFLKVTSRELQAGRMVDVASVYICRCGKRFSAEKELESHVLRPITEMMTPIETKDQLPTAEVQLQAEILAEARTIEA